MMKFSFWWGGDREVTPTDTRQKGVSLIPGCLPHFHKVTQIGGLREAGGKIAAAETHCSNPLFQLINNEPRHLPWKTQILFPQLNSLWFSNVCNPLWSEQWRKGCVVEKDRKVGNRGILFFQAGVGMEDWRWRQSIRSGFSDYRKALLGHSCARLIPECATCCS